MKTEYELYQNLISPKVSEIVAKYGKGCEKEFRVVMNAFSKLCFTLGHGLGYEEAQFDAKRGIDQRKTADEIHVNGQQRDEVDGN